jgi:site-specific DNA-methyltransferase (adenine-specific)
MKKKLIKAENLEYLRGVASNSVDAVVTDPPYGLGKEPDIVEVMKGWVEHGYYEVSGGGFMGKEWDSFVPQPVFWREVFRVLKPGGHALVACGTRTQDWMCASLRFAGFEVRGVVAWVYGSGFNKGKNLGSGMNSSLKPAMELWTLVRKPVEGTIVGNVEKWGTGGLNVDGCRVGTESTIRSAGVKESSRTAYGKYRADDGNGREFFGSESGRYPANFIHDGSDEVIELFPVTKSGSVSPEGFKGGYKGNIYGKYANNVIDPANIYADSGSAARFFYCAKASWSERNAGLDKNVHPTVKPIALMRYLCRLITPPGGLILDPFMGSGTTGIGAALEGFDFLGIEREEEYFNIASARISYWEKTVEATLF